MQRRASQTESGEQKATRKRKKSQKEGTTEPDSATPTPKRRRSSSSAKPRPRRKRSPSLPPFDPDADPGEEIDPTVVTMAVLCRDTGLGRVSSKAAEVQSNHAAWKAQNRERRARMKTLMERKKYGHPESDEERGILRKSMPTKRVLQSRLRPLPSLLHLRQLHWMRRVMVLITLKV